MVALNFLCQVTTFFLLLFINFDNNWYWLGDIQTDICGTSKKACYQNVEEEILNNDDNGMEDECNCLPACTSITYEAEYSQANFDFNGFLNVVKILSQNDTGISFNEQEGYTTKKYSMVEKV